MQNKAFYHGSPTKGIKILKPKLDPRLSVKGLFIADEPFGPMIFSLLPNRAKSIVKYETKNGKFISGKVISPLPLNKIGWLYIVKPKNEYIIDKKLGRYYLDKPIEVFKCKKVSLNQIKKLGWKIEIKK